MFDYRAIARNGIDFWFIDVLISSWPIIIIHTDISNLKLTSFSTCLSLAGDGRDRPLENDHSQCGKKL